MREGGEKMLINHQLSSNVNQNRKPKEGKMNFNIGGGEARERYDK